MGAITEFAKNVAMGVLALMNLIIFPIAIIAERIEDWFIGEEND